MRLHIATLALSLEGWRLLIAMMERENCTVDIQWVALREALGR